MHRNHENPAESIPFIQTHIGDEAMSIENLPAGRFRRTVEDFKCEHCGYEVKGNGYTDHCPKCLWSKHVDINPGDRASECKGMMKPLYADYNHGEYKLHYKCERCGEEKAVTAALDDNKDLLIALTVNVRRYKKVSTNRH